MGPRDAVLPEMRGPPSGCLFQSNGLSFDFGAALDWAGLAAEGFLSETGAVVEPCVSKEKRLIL